MDSIEFYSMEAERLKSLAELERTVAVRQNIGVAFITFDDASVASRYRDCHGVAWSVGRSVFLYCLSRS